MRTPGNNSTIQIEDQAISMIAPPTGAIIGNYVWEDSNGNGVQDQGEKGLSGVSVRLFGERGEFVRMTTTDANGFYRFKNLPAGNYKVQFVTPQGYVLSKKDATVDSHDSDANSNGFTETIRVGDWGRNLNVDAGMVKKSAAVLTGSIGDKVWLDANGNGLQDAGERGVAGVKVELIRAMPDAKPGQFLTPPAPGYSDPIATTTTDAKGNYVFKDVPANQNYQLRFTSPDGYEFTIANTEGHMRRDNTGKAVDQMNFDLIDSDVVSNGMTGKYFLNPGQNINHVDAGLVAKAAPNTGSIGNKVWHDANGNGIQDGGEKGMAGVQVKLWREVDLPTDGLIVARPAPVAVVTTDKNGNYNFDKLTAGDYRVEVVAPKDFRFTKANVGNDNLDSDISSGNSTEVFYLGVGQKRSDIDAGLVKNSSPVVTGSIGDKVWLDANGNGLQDAGERGLAGVKVELIRAMPEVPPGMNMMPPAPGYFDPIAIVKTDAKGNYVFKDVPANQNYQLRFTSPDGYQFTVANVEGHARPAPNGSVSDQMNFDLIDSDVGANGMTGKYFLSPGQMINHIDAGLVKNSPPSINGSIGDKVWVDANGNGIQDSGERGLAGVKLELVPAQLFTDGREIGNMMYVMPIASTQTDANGNYSFKDVAPGFYQIRMQTPEGYRFTKANNGLDSIDSDFAPNGMSNLVEVVAGKHTVDVDAGVVPREVFANGSIAGKTWADAGMFEIEGAERTFGVRDNGEPVMANVAVALYDSKGQLLVTTNTDKDGNYRFSGLKDGDYKLHFAPQGHYADAGVTSQNVGGDDSRDSDVNNKGYTDTISIRGGKTVTGVDAGYVLNDALEIYARVGNRVWNDLDRDGKQDTNEPGMGGVMVHAFNKDGQLVATKQSDTNGNFEFNLNDGEYRLHFDLPVKEEMGWLKHYEFSAKDQTHDAYDSDVSGNGYTDFFKVSGGQLNVNLDAGMFSAMTVMAGGGDVSNLPTLTDLVSDNMSMDAVLPMVAPTTMMFASHEPVSSISTAEAYNKLFELFA